MMPYEQARAHMVDCQINPVGVVSEPILEAFGSIPREVFLPEDKRAVAYIDEDLELPAGRCLMEPGVHARLIQEAEPRKDDVVLDIGCGSGYSAAIFSQFVTTVVALDSDKALLDQAQQNWQKLDVCNVASFQGPLEQGCAEHGPYSLIFINGAVSRVPETLLGQLQEGGRLLAVVREEGLNMGQAMLFQRCGEKSFSERVLFDAAVPYLEEFKPKHEFIF